MYPSRRQPCASPVPPGAIVDNFTRIKKETDGSASMTPEQKQWADSMRASLSGSARAPREPTHPLRRACFRLVRSQPFDYVVMAVIVANVFTMSCEFEGIEDYPLYSWRFRNAMLFFTYFYYGECILKLIGLGPRNYFADRWCRFDFFLVCVSLMDQFFLELLLLFLPVPPTLLRVLRVARVLRILRLVKNLRGLRDLALTLVYAFPSLVNVGALLFVVTFIYAVLGMNLFCRVQHQENISDERNFESFGSAMLLLFQCITGDGWSAFMYDCMINEARGCDPSAHGGRGDCGTRLALPYFISYTIVATFVFINLVVAVILENFTALGSLNADLVSTHDIAVRRPSEEALTRTHPACNPACPACNPAHPACNPTYTGLQGGLGRLRPRRRRSHPCRAHAQARLRHIAAAGHPRRHRGVQGEGDPPLLRAGAAHGGRHGAVPRGAGCAHQGQLRQQQRRRRGVRCAHRRGDAPEAREPRDCARFLGRARRRSQARVDGQTPRAQPLLQPREAEARVLGRVPRAAPFQPSPERSWNVGP